MGMRNSTKSSSALALLSEGILHDAPDLKFPDWSGMALHKSWLTFAEAVRWNDEMLAMFPPKANSAALDAPAKCEIEFTL